MAASELIQLRQRHTVSGLRYEMLLFMPTFRILKNFQCYSKYFGDIF